MTPNKRRSERFSTSIGVRWLRGPRIVDMRTRDVNLHGLFVLTSEKVDVGSLMRLEVSLPDCVITVFVVARFVGSTIDGPGVGVELFVCDQTSRARWSRYYHWLQREHHVKTAALALSAG